MTKMTNLETEGVTLGWMPPWFYDAFVWVLNGGREEKFRREFLDLAHIKPGDCVLDVGCGTGTTTIAAADDALDGNLGEVLGIDPSSSLIKRAKKKASRHFGGKMPEKLRFDQGLGESIPAKDESFTHVLCTFTFHHLGALQKKALKEMNRVLKPGGRLLIVDFPGMSHHHHHHNVCGSNKVDAENDPSVNTIKEADFAEVAAKTVRMMGAIAISARKPGKGTFLASLESDLL